MRVEEIDALLGGEAQRLADKYRTVPVDFMDGYGWAVTQICRLYPDAVPVRHGKFIGTEFDGYADGSPVYYEWKCSECGCVFEDDEPTYNYCPNCGARMDETQKKPCDDCQEFDCYGCEYAERKHGQNNS